MGLKQEKKRFKAQRATNELISRWDYLALMNLFWGGDEKFCDCWINLAICQNLFSLIVLTTSQLFQFF